MEKFSRNDTSQVIDTTSPVQVLIIEDNGLSADIARKFLSDLGCRVDCALDGKTALQYFKQEKYLCDLILMDISLPDTDGYTLAMQIRQTICFKRRVQDNSLHIVALTARDSQENRERCFAAGMSTVLVKPLLKTTAREVLRAYVPKWNIMHAMQDNQTPVLGIGDMLGEPIDFKYALEIHNGDVSFIKKALQVVLDNLVQELEELQSECIVEHWDAARVIVHKLQGGTSYFGLKRVDKVCKQFSIVFKENPKHKWREIYNILVNEVEKVRCAYEVWLNQTEISVK